VVQAVLLVELEPVAGVVPLVLAVRVGVALAVAPVPAVAECWRSEPPSVAAWSQAAPQ
jgi:hypothetical protein